MNTETITPTTPETDAGSNLTIDYAMADNFAAAMNEAVKRSNVKGNPSAYTLPGSVD